jgi:hypothetical protein
MGVFSSYYLMIEDIRQITQPPPKTPKP